MATRRLHGTTRQMIALNALWPARNKAEPPSTIQPAEAVGDTVGWASTC